MGKLKESARLFIAVLAGLITYAGVGSFGLFLLRSFWADYAKSAIDKSYTLEMYWARLFVALVAAMLAGIITTRLSKKFPFAIWIVAAIVFSIVACIHFFQVWTHYPPWYHWTYVLSIIPVMKITGFFVARKS